MKLAIYKSLWGMTGPLPEQIRRIAEAGYQGIEAPVDTVLPAGKDFPKMLADHRLAYVPMLFTGGGEDPASHLKSFEQRLNQAIDLYAPEKVTAHSGRDAWPLDDQLRFYEAALAIEARLGTPVGHETHRGRGFFTPWTTAAVLQRFPTLHLACDFSHWVCVAERLLDDQSANLQLAMERVLHIHGRVGYEEGPQVPHPGAPEWAPHLARHEAWWRSMLQIQKSRAVPVATFSPEFGPPAYLHTLPYTNAPVADLWSVCLWMANHARTAFADLVET